MNNTKAVASVQTTPITPKPSYSGLVSRYSAALIDGITRPLSRSVNLYDAPKKSPATPQPYKRNIVDKVVDRVINGAGSLRSGKY